MPLWVARGEGRRYLRDVKKPDPTPEPSVASEARTRKRRLRFDRLDQVVPEVRRLIPGHRTVGRWTLAQIGRHLADTLHGSIDGMDLGNHRWKRALLGRPLFRITLRYGIPGGYTVDPGLTPPADANLDEAVSALEAAVRRYQTHNGPLQPHPLFGRLSGDDWDRMHRLHCAHHLSFVWPTTE